jgi:hypothetical protein
MYENLRKALEDFGQLLVDEYKDNLLINDKLASGDLYNSVKYHIKTDGAEFQVNLELNHYWKYIENGRKAGKFPPIGKIEEWIRVKPVIPRPMKNGKLPTEQQLAFLISRKIANEGIKPTPILQESIDSVMYVMRELIEDALYKDINSEVEIMFREVGI